MNSSNQFQFLENLVCWGVVAGSEKGPGSVFSLLLGEKVKRDRPLSNMKLPVDVRDYNGECRVYVICSWRLATSEGFICTSWSSKEEGGPMVTGLNRLVGKKVFRVELNANSLDLLILFEEDLVLTIFNDGYTEEDDYTYDYSYCVVRRDLSERQQLQSSRPGLGIGGSESFYACNFRLERETN